ncbi:hypothetical protein AURDEDRAFT_169329 [Auricularia subglabra TFB-10046 SS5]|nr:hypothetical protein AURDEDRAFT_169329 [Auricularia subglabra TFB-10046 SS5]
MPRKRTNGGADSKGEAALESPAIPTTPQTITQNYPDVITTVLYHDVQTGAALDHEPEQMGMQQQTAAFPMANASFDWQQPQNLDVGDYGIHPGWLTMGVAHAGNQQLHQGDANATQENVEPSGLSGVSAGDEINTIGGPVSSVARPFSRHHPPMVGDTASIDDDRVPLDDILDQTYSDGTTGQLAIEFASEPGFGSAHPAMPFAQVAHDPMQTIQAGDHFRPSVQHFASMQQATTYLFVFGSSDSVSTAFEFEWARDGSSSAPSRPQGLEVMNPMLAYATSTGSHPGYYQPLAPAALSIGEGLVNDPTTGHSPTNPNVGFGGAVLPDTFEGYPSDTWTSQDGWATMPSSATEASDGYNGDGAIQEASFDDPLHEAGSPAAVGHQVQPDNTSISRPQLQPKRRRSQPPAPRASKRQRPTKKTRQAMQDGHTKKRKAAKTSDKGKKACPECGLEALSEKGFKSHRRRYHNEFAKTFGADYPCVLCGSDTVPTCPAEYHRHRTGQGGAGICSVMKLVDYDYARLLRFLVDRELAKGPDCRGLECIAHWQFGGLRGICFKALCEEWRKERDGNGGGDMQSELRPYGHLVPKMELSGNEGDLRDWEEMGFYDAGEEPKLTGNEREGAPMASLGLTLLLCFLLRFGAAKQVKVLATDPRIAFSWNWYQPLAFDRVPAIDGFTAGGPNSSVCALGDISRLSRYEGDSFTFAFTGVSAELVFGSRADHSAFSVSYDGKTYHGDTYSKDIACGVAWKSPVSANAHAHTLTATNHLIGGRIYLQLLSIVYNDGNSPRSIVVTGSGFHPSPSSDTPTTGGMVTVTTSPITPAARSTSAWTSRPRPTVTGNPKADHVEVSPNGPTGEDGGSGETSGDGNYEVGRTDSGGPSAPTSNPAGDGGGTHQQEAAAAPERLNTAVAAGVAVTSGLSCLVIIGILFAWRKRCLAKRKHRMMVHPARSESIEAALVESALDGDTTMSSLSRSGSSASSVAEEQQAAVVVPV